MVQHSELVS